MEKLYKVVSFGLTLCMMALPLSASAYNSTYTQTPAQLKRLEHLVRYADGRYQTAKMDYQKYGPSKFLEHFELSDKEKSSIRAKYFRGIPELPSSQQIGPRSILLSTKQGKSVEVEFISLEHSLIKINDQNFVVDLDLEIMDLVKSISSQITPAQASLNFSIFPQAHASLVAGVAMMGVGLALMLKTMFSKSAKNKQSRDGNDSDFNPRIALSSTHDRHPAGANGNLAPRSGVTTVPGISADINATIDNLLNANIDLSELNKSILQSVKSAGDVCGYDKDTANASVAKLTNQLPKMTFDGIGPTHCSGYTYSIFASVVGKKLSNQLSTGALAALKAPATHDGENPYGYFNANGLGTATLFKESGIGTNFTNVNKAKPGDFLKILWSKSPDGKVGRGEFGHSVIYLGGNEKEICFVSANEKDNLNGKVGCGVRCEPRTKIRTMVFSRLDNLGPINEKFKTDMTSKFLKDSRTQSKDLSDAMAEAGVDQS